MHTSIITLQVNFLAACIMTRQFVKQLKERNCDIGHIVMMGRLATDICSENLI